MSGKIKLSEIPEARRQKLLAYAQERLEKEDLLAEAEQDWNAIDRCLKDISDRRGWKLDAMPDVWEVLDNLCREVGDEKIRFLFSSAYNLQFDYYPESKDLEYMQHQFADAKLLLKKLRSIE